MAMSATEREALERLLSIAMQRSGQSRRVASFLLSWWNSTTCGAFDVTNLWNVDGQIALDMLTMLEFFTRVPNRYPDSLGYEEQFLQLVHQWRPFLVADTDADSEYRRCHEKTVGELETWLEMPTAELASLIYVIVQSRGSLPWGNRSLVAGLSDKEVELVEETVASRFARYINKHL